MKSLQHFALLLIFILPVAAFAGENLKINPRLDYSSDSQDGPLITGDKMDEATVAGKPTYVLMYGEGCFNSKRQARRSVHLYEKYKGRVQFVIVDLDKSRPAAQQELVRKYYTGYIPHVVVLDKNGKALYNRSGEEEENSLSTVLDQALSQ